MSKFPMNDFVVEGRGRFPLDMLRYDECWPQTAEDAAAIEQPDHPVQGRRFVKLRTHSGRHPTAKWWDSFNWTVVGTTIRKPEYKPLGELTKDGK